MRACVCACVRMCVDMCVSGGGGGGLTQTMIQLNLNFDSVLANVVSLLLLKVSNVFKCVADLLDTASQLFFCANIT